MKINELIEMGIPLQMAVFHKTVRSYQTDRSGIPEYALYSSGGTPSRTAELWYTPHGVVIVQKYGQKVIPLANVGDTLVKEDLAGL